MHVCIYIFKVGLKTIIQVIEEPFDKVFSVLIGRSTQNSCELISSEHLHHFPVWYGSKNQRVIEDLVIDIFIQFLNIIFWITRFHLILNISENVQAVLIFEDIDGFRISNLDEFLIYLFKVNIHQQIGWISNFQRMVTYLTGLNFLPPVGLIEVVLVENILTQFAENQLVESDISSQI